MTLFYCTNHLPIVDWDSTKVVALSMSYQSHIFLLETPNRVLWML